MTTAAKKEQLMNRKGSKKTAFIYLAPAMVVILTGTAPGHGTCQFI